VVWIILAGVLVAGALCILYGIFVERRWFRLRSFRLDILPASASGPLRVLHLSDLHFTRRDERKARFLASLPPADVTVVTGDLLGEPEAVETAVRALEPARGRVASYFVLGSNDYFRPKPTNYLRYFRRRRDGHRRAAPGKARELVALLEGDGWIYLKNRRGAFSLDGVNAEVGGLDDPHIHRHDIRAAIRRQPDRFGLMVVHSPDPMVELAALGYDLIVSGHTHGGQVRLPVIGALVSNSSVPTRMARGLTKIGDSYVHVSPGLGTSKYAPFRFLCRPEATMLELRAPSHVDESAVSNARS
jgi:predicted MPP superfamily phosphohydrolase